MSPIVLAVIALITYASRAAIGIGFALEDGGQARMKRAGHEVFGPATRRH